MKKIPFYLVVLVVISLLLSACAAAEAKTGSIETVSGQQTNSSADILAEGRVQPVNYLLVGFTIPGQVAEVLVEDGERVSKGQELARLVESMDAKSVLARARQEVLSAQQALDLLTGTADQKLALAQVAYLEATDGLEQAQTRVGEDDTEGNRALLASAEATLRLTQEALTQLEDHNGIDPDELALAEARLASAHAAVESAQALLDAHVLNAPMDGVVVDLNLQSGQQVAAGAPLVMIADISQWVVKTENLTEIEMPGVYAGQKVEVVLDALPDVKLAGEVTHINARFEDKRGDVTYTATILLTQVDPELRWGMTAAIYFLP